MGRKKIQTNSSLGKQLIKAKKPGKANVKVANDVPTGGYKVVSIILIPNPLQFLSTPHLNQKRRQSLQCWSTTLSMSLFSWPSLVRNNLRLREGQW